jgi:hypothetical protein
VCTCVAADRQTCRFSSINHHIRDLGSTRHFVSADSALIGFMQGARYGPKTAEDSTLSVRSAPYSGQDPSRAAGRPRINLCLINLFPAQPPSRPFEEPPSTWGYDECVRENSFSFVADLYRICRCRLSLCVLNFMARELSKKSQ